MFCLSMRVFSRTVLIPFWVLFNCMGCKSAPALKAPLAKLTHTVSLAKKQSIHPKHDPSMILGKALLNNAKFSTGILINGPSKISCTTEKLRNGSIRYTINIIGLSNCRVGSAVPIDKNGYFLTAKHCIGEDLKIICIDQELNILQKPARIVWQNPARDDDIDLAVIKADLVPFKSLSLFKGKLKKIISSRLYSFGWSNIGTFGRQSGEASGLLISAKHEVDQETGNHWSVIRHSVPLATGDSGGPLFNDAGDLVGINQKVYFGWPAYLISCLGINVKYNNPFLSYSGKAILPDISWLNGVVAQDHIQHTSSPLPSVKQLGQDSNYKYISTLPRYTIIFTLPRPTP